MHDAQDRLDKHFQIVKLITSKITVKQKSDDIETVTAPISLTSAIENAEERADMLQTYRAALEEVAAILPQRLSEPLVFKTPEDIEEFEANCNEAIDDALRHIEAVFTGTHKWSPILAKNDPEEVRSADKLPQYVSGVQLILHVKKTGPGSGTVDVFFIALLFDLRAAKDQAVIPLDSDPSVQDAS